MSKEKNASDEEILQPMSQDDLNKRIDTSESDFEHGRFKSGSELLADYE